MIAVKNTSTKMSNLSKCESHLSCINTKIQWPVFLEFPRLYGTPIEGFERLNETFESARGRVLSRSISSTPNLILTIFITI